MNIKINFQASECLDFQNITTLMYNINKDFIEYIDFYNISGILKKLQNTNYKNAFNPKNKYTLVFNPNECNSFLKLVSMSGNLLDSCAYHKAIIIDKCTSIHAAFNALEHQKNIFISNQIFNVPKKLN